MPLAIFGLQSKMQLAYFQRMPRARIWKIHLNTHLLPFSIKRNFYTQLPFSFQRELSIGMNFSINSRSFYEGKINFLTLLRFIWPPRSQIHFLNYLKLTLDPQQKPNQPQSCISSNAKIFPLNFHFPKPRLNSQPVQLMRPQPSFAYMFEIVPAYYPIVAKI